MDGRVKLAQGMIQARNYGPAATLLGKYLRGSPNDVDALYLYGTALYRTNRNAEAEGVFRRWANLAPTNADAHYSLGITLARLGRDEEARESFQQALVANPGFAPALQRLNELASDNKATGGAKVEEVDMDQLTPGVLLVSGHRRLSSYLGTFLLAALVAVAGLLLLTSYREGRMRWLAEHLQIPSVGFLRARYQQTGQEAHRRELLNAIANANGISEFFDKLLIGAAVALLLLAAVMVAHALIASPLTRYDVYERRIDVEKGLLFRQQLSGWLYEIVDVELRQSPMMTLSRNAEVRVYLPQTAAKASRFHDRTRLRIIGFGSFKHQRHLWHEIRDSALKHRRAMRKWYL